MSLDVTNLTATEIGRRVREREVSAEEVTQAYLNRIEALDGKLNAFIRPTPELAISLAREVDEKVGKGESLGPLAGVPVAIKDNISVPGVETSAGSRSLRGYRPIYESTVWERMRQQGLICLGKTNLDEFAMGSSTEHSAFGPTSNPWDLDRVPGGSSGGSAAAVAARLTPLALGSDTGGSVRQPASLCGVVGLKPTYGSVSRFGLIAFASSLDQIGPLARNVTDSALLFDAIRGRDQRDSTTVDYPAGPTAEKVETGIEGLRVGVPAELMGEGIHPETRDAIRRVVDRLSALGIQVGEVHLPHLEHSIATYYIVACAEASSNLARYDGIRYGHRTEAAEDLESLYTRTRGEGFAPEVKRRIILGTYVLSSGYYDAYYLKAQKLRTLMRRDFQEVHREYDVLLSPVSPTTAFRKGEKSEDPLEMYLADLCTLSANLAGVPALSVPCGFSAEGLPIGVQLMGRPFEEATILRMGRVLEQELDVPDRMPDLG